MYMMIEIKSSKKLIIALSVTQSEETWLRHDKKGVGNGGEVLFD